MSRSRMSLSWSSRRKRPGYVLLLALVTLCLAALVLAEVASNSLEMAVNSRDAAEQLQLRWGFASLRYTAATHTSRLARRPATNSSTVPVAPDFPWSDSLELGGIRFDLRVENENTKLNLNRLYRLANRDRIQQVIARLCPTAICVRLRPVGRTTAGLTTGQPLASWGQVFDLALVPRDAALVPWLEENTQGLTLWGNGRLAFRDTPMPVIEALLGDRFPPQLVGRIAQARQSAGATVATVAQSLALSDTQREYLLTWLTDDSAAFLLRVDARPAHRIRHEWSLVQRDQPPEVLLVW